MKFEIWYNGKYEDNIIIEGDTIEEIREQAFVETEKRGWDKKDCHSERIEN